MLYVPKRNFNFWLDFHAAFHYILLRALGDGVDKIMDDMTMSFEKKRGFMVTNCSHNCFPSDAAAIHLEVKAKPTS